MKQVTLVIAILSLLGGCVRRPVPLPPRPLVPPPAQERALKIVEAELPPQLEIAEDLELTRFPVFLPTAPPPRIRLPRPIVVRKKDTPEPVKLTIPKPVTPAFRLGELLTPAQQLELISQTDAFLATSEQAVATAATVKPKLTSDQDGLVGQIKALISQSRNARNSDLVEARKLAERSKTLSEALVRSLSN